MKTQETMLDKLLSAARSEPLPVTFEETRAVVEEHVQAGFHNKQLSTSTYIIMTTVSITILTALAIWVLPGEKVRMRVTGNPPHGRSTTRRVSPGDTYTLDLGYVADVIDRVAPHAYTLTFYDADRNPVDCIRISVEADGAFIVNGEKRGAF